MQHTLQRRAREAMDEFIAVTAVLFVILIAYMATAVRAIHYWGLYRHVRHPRALLSHRLPSIKSGDVLFFIPRAHGFTNSLFTHDMFSHAGMVVEKDGALWLSESTVETPEMGGASLAEPIPGACAMLTPLVPRLKYYPGSAYLMSLAAPLDAGRAETLRARVRLTAPYPKLVHAVRALAVGCAASGARHCMQHVAWLLDEMGMTPVDSDRDLLDEGFFAVSRVVTSLPGVELGGGYRYDDITELLFDLDAA